ncbi:MAG: NAD(P)H-dependent oxidoreductase [Bacteroidetes bacterium]|nr:NAD(P)H-dependent oxidoreductase [Bacteroidota bacterium]
MNLVEDLNWRYATKKMNGTAVPQEKVDYILEAARLAPSSSGLQPFEIIVISNKELLEKVKPVANGQGQITDCSHLLVFAAWDTYTEERITEVFNRTIAERQLPENTMDAYKAMLIGAYPKRPADVNFQHAAKQAYISLGIAMAAAAEQKVDATPMEGFNNEALDELLNLKAKGLRSAVILPLGYRDEANDWLVKLKKVRTPKEKFITELK